tara:strand:+ start:1334 stop:2644 length:1311 start_codon:yes stop_codon:yes gene_type:complete
MENKIIKGDCIQCMQSMQDNSVDAIVTDPPYGLEFMGKDWDKFGKAQNIGGGTMKNRNTPFQRGDKTPPAYYIWTNKQKHEMQHFFQEFAIEALRVLKPGGFLLAFGGSRTYHRLACGIEDAGFEIRDQIMWLYGSGFPKSLNIGKQLEKQQVMMDSLVREWEGWGTALKPAHEPIVVARKPLAEKNVALNVLKYGTGGINIDACRIGTDKLDKNWRVNPSVRNKETEKHLYGDYNKHNTHNLKEQGRFPANIILDEEAGKMLDEQSGILGQGHWSKTKTTGFGEFGNGTSEYFGVGEKDKTKHGASRFFYCAKASKSERNLGCENMDEKSYKVNFRESPKEGSIKKYGIEEALEKLKNLKSKNNHPTVKPIKLMEYLIKLVSKEGAVVLDPFLGSGTTGIACAKLNRNFIGIEKEEEYVKIAEARIKPFLQQRKL